VDFFYAPFRYQNKRKLTIMTLITPNPCPFGILNLNAAAEVSSILQESSKVFHQQLHAWLIENYLSGALQTSISENTEPLGRRVKSAEDLNLLVCAYSNTRALKQKTKKSKMDNELYFYGQLPDRNAAVEAGSVVHTRFNPEATTGSGRTVNGTLSL
jgi:hypothetical protein